MGTVRAVGADPERLGLLMTGVAAEIDGEESTARSSVAVGRG
jgi:hypothetical protein